MAVLCIVFTSLSWDSDEFGFLASPQHIRSTDYNVLYGVQTQSNTYYDYLADLHPCRVLEFSPY